MAVVNGDVDAYLHLWNVIGHQLGLDESLMAQNASEATDLIDNIRRRQFRGCLEDWRIDQFQLDVIRLEEIARSD